MPPSLLQSGQLPLRARPGLLFSPLPVVWWVGAGISMAGDGGQLQSLSAFATPAAQRDAAGLEVFARGLDKC